MVYGVVGKLGGGKSFSCVWIMLEKLKAGQGVVSNIRLKDEYLQKHSINASRYLFIDDFGKVDPWTLPKGDLRGSGGSFRVMICIDEAGEWLDSYSDARTKGTQLSDIASWLRQSDKLGQDVYFIVQFETLLHARLRSIVARWLVCLDFDKFRFPFIGLPPPRVLRQFIVCSEYDGRSRDFLSRHWIPKNKTIFEAYDTAAFFGQSFARSSSADTLNYTGQNYVAQFELPVVPLILFVMLCYLICAVLSYFWFF